MIAPGTAVKAKRSPDLKSIRFKRLYAIEPERALKKATVSVILVILAGLSSGYMKSNMGTSKNPPATPISVPKTPINRPIKASNIQTQVVSMMPP
jgi:hypothetical protein